MAKGNFDDLDAILAQIQNMTDDMGLEEVPSQPPKGEPIMERQRSQGPVPMSDVSTIPDDTSALSFLPPPPDFMSSHDHTRDAGGAGDMLPPPPPPPEDDDERAGKSGGRRVGELDGRLPDDEDGMDFNSSLNSSISSAKSPGKGLKDWGRGRGARKMDLGGPVAGDGNTDDCLFIFSAPSTKPATKVNSPPGSAPHSRNPSSRAIPLSQLAGSSTSDGAEILADPYGLSSSRGARTRPGRASGDNVLGAGMDGSGGNDALGMAGGNIGGAAAAAAVPVAPLPVEAQPSRSRRKSDGGEISVTKKISQMVKKPFQALKKLARQRSAADIEAVAPDAFRNKPTLKNFASTNNPAAAAAALAAMEEEQAAQAAAAAASAKGNIKRSESDSRLGVTSSSSAAAASTKYRGQNLVPLSDLIGAPGGRVPEPALSPSSAGSASSSGGLGSGGGVGHAPMHVSRTAPLPPPGSDPDASRRSNKSGSRVPPSTSVGASVSGGAGGAGAAPGSSFPSSRQGSGGGLGGSTGSLAFGASGGGNNAGSHFDFGGSGLNRASGGALPGTSSSSMSSPGATGLSPGGGAGAGSIPNLMRRDSSSSDSGSPTRRSAFSPVSSSRGIGSTPSSPPPAFVSPTSASSAGSTGNISTVHTTHANIPPLPAAPPSSSGAPRVHASGGGSGSGVNAAARVEQFISVSLAEEGVVAPAASGSSRHAGGSGGDGSNVGIISGASASGGISGGGVGVGAAKPVPRRPAPVMPRPAPKHKASRAEEAADADC